MGIENHWQVHLAFAASSMWDTYEHKYTLDYGGTFSNIKIHERERNMVADVFHLYS